jgi:hypothetical protein
MSVQIDRHIVCVNRDRVAACGRIGQPSGEDIGTGGSDGEWDRANWRL